MEYIGKLDAWKIAIGKIDIFNQDDKQILKDLNNKDLSWLLNLWNTRR